MNETLTCMPKLPVAVIKLGVPATANTHGNDRKTVETHKGYSIDDIHFRADTITQTLKSILDFHPVSHVEMP